MLSIGANALQVTLTLNFGGREVVPDRKGLNISSIYGSNHNSHCNSDFFKKKTRIIVIVAILILTSS